jgi:hypothetical protein
VIKPEEDAEIYEREACDNTIGDVLWTRNGYHIYVPVAAPILELESIFARFEEPSRRFIRWTEQFLINVRRGYGSESSLMELLLAS